MKRFIRQIIRKTNYKDRSSFRGAGQKRGEVYQTLFESEREMIIAMMDALKPGEPDARLDALGKALESLGG